MSDNQTASQQARSGGNLLRRLLAARRGDAGRTPQLPAAPAPTPTRAASVALARTAARLYEVEAQPVDIAPGALVLGELPELLPDPALLAILEGPAEPLGVMALSPEIVTALIEVQALGRITDRAPERRRMTRSDAILCADFVNMLLAELGRELAGFAEFEGWTGYRYASHLDDPRPLALMLDDGAFRSLTMRLTLERQGKREGVIFLALPHPVEAAPPPPSDPRPDPAPSSEAGPPARIAASLAASVAAAPIRVQGILCRRRISLGQLRGLAAGQVLPLPQASLGNVRLETASGQFLASGRLGEADGCHAIRLHDPQSGRHGPAQPNAQPIGHSFTHVPPIDDLARPDPFRNPVPSPARVKDPDPDTDAASDIGTGKPPDIRSLPE